MDSRPRQHPAKGPTLVLLFLVAGCAAREPVRHPAPAIAAPPPPLQTVERVIELGASVDGRPLYLHVLGHPADPWPTLILAAIHGNEPTSAAVAQDLLTLLRSEPALLGHRKVAVLPVANPDGLERRIRTNKNLIDLNRNFPASNWKKTRKGVHFGGQEPSSEPETIAVMRAFDLLRPARVVSIHSMDQPCNNYDGPAAALAALMSRSNGYPVKASIGYPTPGSLGSWSGTDRGIPTITLELPRARDAQSAWRENRQALLVVIRAGESLAEVKTVSAAP